MRPFAYIQKSLYLGMQQYNFNFYNSLILAGIVQGLIFGAIVISSKKYRAPGTLFLAALIVVFSLNNLQYYLPDTYLIRNRIGYGIIWTPAQLFMAPLMLFYGLKLFHPDRPIAKRTLIIFSMPFAIGLVVVNWLKLTHRYLEYKPLYMLIEAIIEFTSIFLTAGIVSWLLVQTIKIQARASFSNTVVQPKLQWFRNTLIVFLALCVPWFLITWNMVLGSDLHEAWYVMWVSLSVMIYWIGHVGIYKYGIEEERKKIRSYSIEQKMDYKPDRRRSEHIAALEELLVHQKRFRDPQLTLESIADELKLSKTHLSRLVNSELSTGFPEYLNNLRVTEAKSYLENPEFSNYTLVAIGLEAGFNSKTTFNTAFKKYTGMTPSEYRNRESSGQAIGAGTITP